MGSLTCMLPDDIMVDILKALPLETIHRFKAVSKTWEQFLSCYNFMRIFSISPSLETQPLYVFLGENCNERHLLYANDFELNNPPSSQKTLFHNKGLDQVACSNGMVCCLIRTKMSWRKSCSFEIGNPLIQREFIPLPEFEFDVINFAFHFNPRMRDLLLLVNSRCFRNQHSLSNFRAVQIFDSITGEWKRTRAKPPFHPGVNSMLLSIGTTCYGFSSDWNSVVAFDMKKEKWQKIPTPMRPIMGDIRIQDREGKLCIMLVTKEKEAHIWVLDEERTWVEQVRADLKEFGLRYAFVYPTLWIGDTFLLRSRGKFMAYDTNSNQMETFAGPLEWVGDFYTYCPTLLTCKFGASYKRLKLR
ncbi:F-box only protein 8 [Amborella trichopoda]|uniref:F-box domain-containing protein n=1 Tax=Amborella trichopoda TaxID=13333 RepID=U5D8P5_AMBTC|nr:F-box only protein 8 [Amborella trichopoda]ERN18854.1 hypothetical protein AMTR_s00067p00135850 [Amborella trichopoda]|eukprot:XP_006857387.1 F-box only protein 8 [Amborella trichopoda]